MKSKEYEEAVTYYSKSLELFEEAATYSNRAMANLRLKRYVQVIEDSNNCLRLDPNYLKAFHRRGKAYLARKQYDDAIKDFQTILEKEPENRDINADLMEARRKLNDAPPVEEVVEEEEEVKPAASKPTGNVSNLPVSGATKNLPVPPKPKMEEQKFKRVNIIEDSDSEEAEETPKAPEPPKPSEDKPLIQEVSSKPVDKKGGDWLKQKDSNYS
jgi:tetratricopeptide (TPR) repeat protein